jgi:hypothetical protein
MTTMTSHTAARRPTSTPHRILTAGLATAACIGVVGMLGARTIEANAAAAESDPIDLAVSAAPTDAVDQTAGWAADPASVEQTSSAGLTREQLDAYAAELAKEAARLDAYRAKLTKAARKLQRQVAANSGGSTATWSAPTTVAAAPTQQRPAAKPKGTKPSKPQSGNQQPAAQQPAAQQPAAQQPAPQAPAPAPAPAAKQAPAQQQAPAAKPAQPQSTSKGS